VKRTILIVDDTPDIIKLLEFLLIKMGFAVVSDRTGLQVLDKMKLQAPDLVFLDLHLPDCSGVDICKAIKADPALQSIPVILMSASEETIRKHQVEAKADGLMVKPFLRKDLEKITHEFLS
jgi:CheY-like chemotaxis protein